MSVKQTKRAAARQRQLTMGCAAKTDGGDAFSLGILPLEGRVRTGFSRWFLLVPGLPLIGLLVRFWSRPTSARGLLYCQVRVGRHGRKFKMYKIRTMHHDAESGTGPVWTQTAHDPRITALRTEYCGGSISTRSRNC